MLPFGQSSEFLQYSDVQDVFVVTVVVEAVVVVEDIVVVVVVLVGILIS